MSKRLMFFADPANESLYRPGAGRRMAVLSVEVYLVVVASELPRGSRPTRRGSRCRTRAGILDWLCLVSRFVLGLAPFVLLPAVVLAVRNALGRVGRAAHRDGDDPRERAHRCGSSNSVNPTDPLASVLLSIPRQRPWSQRRRPFPGAIRARPPRRQEPG